MFAAFTFLSEKKKNTDEWFLMFLLMVNDVNKYKNWSTKNIEAYRLAATCKKGHFDALLRDAFFPLGETIRLAWRL